MEPPAKFCSSAVSFMHTCCVHRPVGPGHNIEAFITKVSILTYVTVRFIELPYNDLDSFRLPSAGLDGVIICHSINNRRFAITDVTDALYDKFLPRVRRNFGKDSVCVIAHDFQWPMGPAGSSHENHIRIKDTHMDSFRSKQFTTFECSKLAMICGRLDRQVDMDEEDWKQLEDFLLQCRKGLCGNSIWICFIPFHLTCNSCWFALLSLVERCCSCVCQCPGYLGSINGLSSTGRVFAPVEDDSLLPVAQRSREAQRIYYILLFVCLPVIILLTMADCILLRMRPNGTSCSLCILFKKDVINKTLKQSEDCKGLCGNSFWICFIPFHLTCNSCWFALSLVEGCCSCVCQCPGFINSRYLAGPRKVDLIRA